MAALEASMTPDQKIEEIIRSKGLTGLRVTPERIDEVIHLVEYHVFEGSQLTTCLITLINGFTVLGESACVSPENFDEEIGRKVAYANARDKIWALEGYLLKQQLHKPVSLLSEDIAMICHEVNKAYCEALGDLSQLPWETAPAWARQSAVSGVEFHDANPVASASASHNSWLDEKIKDGWIYGELKDPEKKTHPCIVPFEELSVEQQAKDHIFRAVVHSIRDLQASR